MTSREALQTYINKLARYDVPWYGRAASFHYWMWNILSLAPLVVGVASALIAGMIKENQFEEQGKVWLIILPLVGGFASTLLTKFRFDQMEDLLERGNQAIDGLVEKAKIDVAAAKTDDECQLIHEKLLKEVKALDLQQHEDSWAILRSPIRSGS